MLGGGEGPYLRRESAVQKLVARVEAVHVPVGTAKTAAIAILGHELEDALHAHWVVTWLS